MAALTSRSAFIGRSHEVRSAIDVDVGTGRVRVALRGKERHNGGNLLGESRAAEIRRLVVNLAYPAHDVVRVARVIPTLLEDRLELLGETCRDERARTHGVDEDAFRCKGLREVLRDARECFF